MRKCFVACLAAGAVTSGGVAPAMAQEARSYKPAGQWALDYGDDYCRLSRSFSDGKDAVDVAFERIQPGPFMRMILVSDAIKPFRSAEEIGWHFTPGGGERKTRYTKSQTTGGTPYYNLGLVTLESAPGDSPGPFVVRRTIVTDSPAPPPMPRSAENTGPPPPPPYDRAMEQAVAKALTGFVVDSGLNKPVQIETGALDAPIAALQACADDLAETWGLDAAKLKSQTAPAVPEGGGVGWLPQGMIAFGDFGKLSGGSNQVRLMVDAAGMPTSCIIHWASLDQTTNDKICKALMTDAKFTPAKDADGQPMAGYWIASPLFLGPPMPGGRRGG